MSDNINNHFKFPAAYTAYHIALWCSSSMSDQKYSVETANFAKSNGRGKSFVTKMAVSTRNMYESNEQKPFYWSLYPVNITYIT